MVHLSQKETDRRDQRAEFELITTESERASKRHSDRQRPASYGGGGPIAVPGSVALNPPSRNLSSNADEDSPAMTLSSTVGNLHSFSLHTSSILPEGENFRPSYPSSLGEQMSYTTVRTDCYKCDECGEGFGIRSHLKRHQLGHEKPEVCMKCDEPYPAFPTKSELKRHEEGRHPTKKFYCKKVPCRGNKRMAQKNGTHYDNSQIFGSLTKIRRHLRNVHNITTDLDTWIEDGNSEEPVENLAEQLLLAQIEEPYDSGSHFLPINQLNRLLVEPNVRQQLRKIFPTMKEDKIEFYTQSICSTSKKLFAVLICTLSGAQSRTICNFIQEGINDTDLPFARLYPSDQSANVPRRFNQIYTLAKESHASCKLPDHTSCGIKAVSNWPQDQVQTLCRDQWLVLAPIFESTPGTIPLHLSIPDSAVLPFTEDRENDSGAVKFGGYSEVWAIRIHESHQNMLKPTPLSGHEPLIAVKRLISRKPEVFERERRMLSQLTLKKHPHLVRLLITYRYKGRFHLLYPYAECNLRDYWRTHAKPVERDTCLWALQQICGLASALNQIHNFSTKPTLTEDPESTRERPHLNVSIAIDRGEEIFGRHGDLKPENILWLNDLEDVDPLGILQITDFGLGQFHRRESRSKQNPAHINGSPTYSPPELLLDKYVSRAYDIWSLGCLFLEFITWIMNGNNGVETFADARMAAAFDGIIDDTYYTLIITDSGRRAEVREGVTTWIGKLRHHEYCSAMINDLLDLVQNRMLQVESGDRIRARELDSILKKMLERAKADTVYLLGNILPNTIGERNSLDSPISTSTVPSKHDLTLTDRTRSQPRKRR